MKPHILLLCLLCGCGEKFDAHRPIKRTTNGSVITAIGWDKANKCDAIWCYDTGGTFYSWSRLDTIQEQK